MRRFITVTTELGVSVINADDIVCILPRPDGCCRVHFRRDNVTVLVLETVETVRSKIYCLPGEIW